MSKRQTIGTELMEQLNNSPFDLLVPHKEPLNGNASEPPSPNNTAKPSKKKKPDTPDEQPQINGQDNERNGKDRITVQINKNTIERVKDCVYWNRLTVAQFVEEALEAALKEAEKENGKPFQKRRSELKPGRPIR